MSTPTTQTVTLRDAVRVPRWPERSSPVSATLTFAHRALLKITHVPEQLFDVTLSPIIFTLMFTYLFGGAIAGDTSSYLQFLLPGIVVQSVLLISVYTGFTINTDITKGVFDRFRSLPIWRPAPIVGALLGDSVRYAIAATVTIGLGLVLGYRPGGGVFGVLGAVALLLVFAFALSWIFIILGLVLRTPNAVMGVSMMVLMPLTFASNIFAPPETMPAGLQAWVEVNRLIAFQGVGGV
ncbi:MAG: ABC transporter permease [Cellulomonadaceae bacterium]